MEKISFIKIVFIVSYQLVQYSVVYYLLWVSGSRQVSKMFQKVADASFAIYYFGTYVLAYIHTFFYYLLDKKIKRKVFDNWQLLIKQWE